MDTNTKDYADVHTAIQRVLLEIHTGSIRELSRNTSCGLFFSYDGLGAQGEKARQIINRMRSELGAKRVRMVNGAVCGRCQFEEMVLVCGRYCLEYPAGRGETKQREFNYLVVFTNKNDVVCIMINSLAPFCRYIKIVATNESVYFWKESDIAYVESDRDHVLWHGNTGTVRSVACLGKIQEQLSENFLKVHRSFLVNINRISSIQRCNITMNNGDQIPVPYKKYTKIKEEICKKRGW